MALFQRAEARTWGRRFNVHATAVFSKSYTEQVGGTAIAGYLNSALANREGELVVPAIITGTFANPRFAVDTEQMAQMKLKGLLPTSDNPAGALSGILGSITGQKSQTPGKAAAPAQKPADTLNKFWEMYWAEKRNNTWNPVGLTEACA